MPKVSVLLSNYNGDKHLDESISSVLSQTYKDFEFIIVDDASTDSSRKVIENYHDKRIKKYYTKSQTYKKIQFVHRQTTKILNKP